MRLSNREYNEIFGTKKGATKSTPRNKFGAKRTEYNGRTYDSKKEAARAAELDRLRKAGEIKKIEYQPRYDIIVNDKKIAYYKADFRITYADGRIVVEDVKGYKKGAAYSVFRLKKKLVEALYDIEIVEV